MTDQTILYGRVALVLLAAVAVGYIWLGPYVGDRATATAAIIAALGSLLGLLQIQKVANDIRPSIARSADIERTTIKRE